MRSIIIPYQVGGCKTWGDVIEMAHADKKTLEQHPSILFCGLVVHWYDCRHNPSLGVSYQLFCFRLVVCTRNTLDGICLLQTKIRLHSNRFPQWNDSGIF